MNILMVHGYLFEGSGSNILVQNLAKAYCEEGHTVTLVCQQRKCETYDFVSSHHMFNENNSEVHTLFDRATPYPGKCHVYNPFIGKLLPVYVADTYESFPIVKEFPTLSQDELEHYIAKNTTALRYILSRTPIDVVHAQHIIMSPYVVQRALQGTEIPYFISSHGSELNYSISAAPHLKKYAIASLQHARMIFTPSDYLKSLICEAFRDNVSHLESRILVIPNGVDTGKFHPVYSISPKNLLELQAIISKRKTKETQGKTALQKKEFETVIKHAVDVKAVESEAHHLQKEYNYYEMDQDIFDMLTHVQWGKEKTILYVGKFLQSKGPHILLLAYALLRKKYADAKLIFVGYGTWREELEAIQHALNTKNMGLVLSLVGSDKKFISTQTLEHLSELPENHIQHGIYFTGLLTHPELSLLIPLVSTMVVPSLFPETFGMTAIEGMACGIPTLVTYQSGLADIHDREMNCIEPFGISLHPLILDDKLIENLTFNLDLVFQKEMSQNRFLKKSLHVYTEKYFSWKSIAKQLITVFQSREQHQR